MAEINYQTCSKCGAPVISLFHYMTGSRIEIDPLPVGDGSILPSFVTGRCRVVPLKHLKKYSELWQPHVVSCQA